MHTAHSGPADQGDREAAFILFQLSGTLFLNIDDNGGHKEKDPPQRVRTSLGRAVRGRAALGDRQAAASL
jgi:hypothetical protein